ncbi:hypothetical protein PFHG_02062 [Plasmodium falciparum HB3]|uniref:Vesicle transport v-SNARE N-terminal domain-containing protein n=1 Tax=Plasmodium falciparum (isolate HB3) TaxID=137071 RepID=A0A0L7KBA0_PLAFX|nr:hypothetical protein PFHG_02062 [Plasmodium falciparum HB3]
MITYSEYFDDYVEDLNRYLHKIKHSIYNITNKEDYNKTREYIFEAEKCIKQINIEINMLSQQALTNFLSRFIIYKHICMLNSRQYDMTKKYKEGVDFLKESERRAQDIEDIGKDETYLIYNYERIKSTKECNTKKQNTHVI